MKRYSILGGLAATLLALPAAAQETAYTTAGVTLDAGPAGDYPVVVALGPGTPVALYGCLDGWTWCDVSFQDARGWVSGEALAFPYQDQRVPIATYGAVLSLPIVSFSFGNYWEQHYRGRPFYGERERFERHAPPPPPPHRPPPPPLRREGEGRPPVHGPEGHPQPHPEPGVRPPEPHPQGVVPHPGEPHPPVVQHPVEPHPQAVQRPPEPHPGGEARPGGQPRPQAAPRAPEPHPQGSAHPSEEHREPEQHQ